MNYNEALEFLFKNLPNYQNLGNSAIRPGLHNIKLLCEKFDNPQKNFKSIHIGGTNGKGTTSATIANLCLNLNLKIGLFSSPHVFDFRERIQVDGKKIKKKFVKKFINSNFNFFDKIKPSFFEISTLMAFEYFKVKRVDLAIIEVGLGGRFDSTNIISPFISLVTNVGYDHQNVLGNTLQEIANEKAGIIKEKTVFFKGEVQNDVDNIFKNECIKKNTKFIYSTDEINIETISKSIKNRKIDVTYNKNIFNITLSNPTEYFLKNSYSSFKIFFYLLKYFKIKRIKKIKLKKRFKVFGRWNIISKKPIIIADGCHNYDAFNSIINEIESYEFKNVYFVIGGVKEKDWKKISSSLPKKYFYVVTKPNIERSKDLNELYDIFKMNNLNVRIKKNINESINYCKRKVKSNDLIFIGGSLFLISDFNEK
ncbi:MAG: bifunctional folylpolyglutamate synthase/dihydrofolate synthase [Cytophagia bacterium]|nr:bifunctional folylpolyglutamate synthase/dihydrofolate synthase [Cytophagia bacterium]